MVLVNEDVISELIASLPTTPVTALVVLQETHSLHLLGWVPLVAI